MKQMTTDEAIKRWDRHAEFFTSNYDEQHGDLHREVLLNPAILSLIEQTDGMKMFDAGCGEGYLSRIFARRGASVTSIDYSKKMLEIAKRKTPTELGIRYHHGNCERLDFLDDCAFDFIVSNMVIQDLADYEAALNEMFRLLKNGGYLVFSILHPCFVTPNSGWVRNSAGQKLYWKTDKYFYEGVYEQSLPADAAEKIVYYHRSLSSYFKAIQKAGFILEELVEPKPSKEMLIKYPHFEEDFNISNFLVFKARKRLL